MSYISLSIGDETYRADSEAVCDLSIAVNFNEPQLQAYGAPPARAQALHTGEFIGAVLQNGSCNCATYSLTPHCNGTHTESVAHLTQDLLSINTLARHGLMLASLVTVDPISVNVHGSNPDQVLTLDSLKDCLKNQLNYPIPQALTALIVRTTPNQTDKTIRNYDQGSNPAYFEPAALRWLAEIGIEHLLVDLPSVDRMDDGGALLAHRAFWGLPVGDKQLRHASRPHATITELIYVPDSLLDGLYLLNLQIAPFLADAAPSRPLVYPVLPP
mgnify:CR=1 FL=1